MAMLLKIPFSFQCREGKRPARSLLADWDFLPCVTVSVIAMSHFKDFMWVDWWSTTRERTVVKIPINEGQRNMTWTASGPYLPMAEPVDWNCIPSALGRGSALSVGAGRLHFPLAGSRLVPLSAHPGVHPVLTSWWWIHNFREKMNSSSSEILCYIIMQTTKSSSTCLTVTEVTQGNAFLFCSSFELCAEVQPNHLHWSCRMSLSVVFLPLLMTSCSIMLLL